MTFNARDKIGAALNVGAAGATLFNLQGFTSAISTQLIGAVTLDNDTFTEGDPDGTVVGAITVTMNAASPSFSGTLSLSGADAADFAIDTGNLVLNGTGGVGDFDINIVATQDSTIGNSPKAQPFTITGEAASGYTASAVHLDGANVKLVCASLSATDGPNMFAAFWVKFAASQTQPAGATVWVVDPNGDYLGFCNYISSDDPVFATTIAAPGSTSASVGTADMGPGVWFCVLASMINGVRRQLYLGDVSSLDAGGDGGDDNSFDGLQFNFGDDEFDDGAVCDIADFRLWTDIAPDISVEATRRLFIDAGGKPVNPATATGSLGDPTILFSGNSVTFPVNQGTGGGFTLTGSLTNASTSPSD